MPDGDRFERRLRGKGWASVYRLGCSLAPVEAVVDKVMGAVAHLLRTQNTQVIRDVFRELQDASQLIATDRLRESVSEQAFNQLASAAMTLKEDAGHSELARFAERAGLRTFNEMDKSGERWDDSVLKRHFTRNLIWELGERRCFAVTREGIMEATHRDQSQQLAWESNVRELLLRPSAAIAKNLISEEATAIVRAPKRLFRPKSVTMETLTTPLEVLGNPR